MKITGTLLMTALALVSFPAAGRAEAPSFVPVQGVLTDAGGIPIDGEVEVLFAIYPGQGGDPALWSETQTVLVENGLFSVYLGQVVPLDLSVFRDHGDLRLGITVGQDQEMPRITLGSTPFAGYAEYCGADALGGLTCGSGQVAKYDGSAWICADDNDSDTLTGLSCANGQVPKWNVVEWECANDTDTDTDTDTLADLSCQDGQVAMYSGGSWACASLPQSSVPSGTVLFFNLPDCPPGYTELAGASGRYLVGRPAGGTLGASVGTALGDQENRAVGLHGHTASTAPHSHGLPFYNYSNDNYSGLYLVSGPDRGDNLQVTNSANVSVTVADSGTAAGTPAPYLQLTVCVKD